MKLTSMTKVLAAALIVSSMTAALPAHVSAEDAQASAQTVQAAQTKAQTKKIGKVTAVNGTKVTIALGEIERPERPQKSKTDKTAANTAVDKTAANAATDKTASNAAADKTASKTDKTASDKKAKPEGGRKGQSFKESGETVTADLAAVTVTKDGKAASAADIKEGDIVTLVYEGTTLKEVKCGHGFGGRDKKDRNTDKTAKTAKTKKTDSTQQTSQAQTV
ncbi:MAG: hypothetical protein IJ251_04955 [Oscillospiraceae bacterium]|nr:hypothetical protein [Oscillospiraceae bacterium]